MRIGEKYPGATENPVPGLGMGIALVLVSAAAFGLMPVLARLAYGQGVNVKTLLALRFTLAAVAMWIVWLVETRRNPGQAAATGPGGQARPLSFAVVVPLVLLGALGYVGQSFSYFTAASIISAAATALLLYVYPILVTLLARIIFHETLTPRKLLALGMASLGAVLVLNLGTSLFTGGGALGALDPAGVAWGLAAAVIYSIYIIAGTRYARGIHPIFSSAVIITSAAGVYLAWGSVTGELSPPANPEAWAIAITIALVCTVVAIGTFFAGLALIGPSRAAIISTLEPAVSVVLAALVLGETVSAEQAAGGALILASVLVLQSGQKSQKEAAGTELAQNP